MDPESAALKRTLRHVEDLLASLEEGAGDSAVEAFSDAHSCPFGARLPLNRSALAAGAADRGTEVADDRVVDDLARDAEARVVLST